MLATKPTAVWKRVHDYSSRPTPTEYPEPKKQGVIIGDLNRAVAEWAKEKGLFNNLETKGEANAVTDENRHLLLGWLFTPEDQVMHPISSKELTPQDWHALDEWIGSQKVGDRWIPRDMFHLEANWCLTRAKSYQHMIAAGNQITIQEHILEWNSYEPSLEQVEIEPGGVVEQSVSYLGGDISQFIEQVITEADEQIETWYNTSTPPPVYDPEVDKTRYVDLDEEGNEVALPAPPVPPAPPKSGDIPLFEF